MQRLIWTAIVLVFAVLAVTGPLKMIRPGNEAGAGTVSYGSSRVGMSGLAFSPAELNVASGTEVVFDNDDAAPHTVTAADGSVDSGILNPGQVFRLVVNEPFEYQCLIHPDMTARIELSG